MTSEIVSDFNRELSQQCLLQMVDGWCWFVVREKYCLLVTDGWFVPREKYRWLVADKPNEQGAGTHHPLVV
jgi:hypothetical protein